MVLAGGGLKHCGAYGVTDDLSKKVVEKPVSVPDFHATILAAMGVDTKHDLMDGARPVPITDGGKPIAELLG
jgi:arylsulfatase A-like enzyme